MDLKNLTEKEFNEEWGAATQRERDRFWLLMSRFGPPTPRKPRKVLCVYFIESDGLIKIGKAIVPQKRLESLQRFTTQKMLLLGSMPQTVATEFEVHKRFAHLRRHGEWFTDCEELRTYIAEVTT